MVAQLIMKHPLEPRWARFVHPPDPPKRSEMVIGQEKDLEEKEKKKKCFLIVIIAL